MRWSCPACKETGLLPRLDDTTLDTIETAIARGHERRAPVCHRTRGTRRIAFVFDGVTMRFGKSDAPAIAPSPEVTP
ncbi:MAG TPA: hypothetical protein VN600_06860 [Gemmatimonadaceae bacterium]|nr:hypothetical protein [Gemmatimonadaceae bacterium]